MKLFEISKMPHEKSQHLRPSLISATNFKSLRLLYYRFSLSLRDVELIMAERGLDLTYETIRFWCIKFAPHFVKKLKAKKQWGDQWFLDEVHCCVGGEMMTVWRAVDQDGQTLDILVQRKRNAEAASRFFRKLRRQGDTPRIIVTDKLKSYSNPDETTSQTPNSSAINVLITELKTHINLCV